MQVIRFLQSFKPIKSLIDRQAHWLQDHLYQFAEVGIIVNQQNSFAHATCFAPRGGCCLPCP